MSSVRVNRKGTHSVLRRTLGIILIILGLASAGLGVASATVWRESDTVVATAQPQGDGTLVVSDPGVLELVGSDVTIEATNPGGGQVTVVVGRDIDVEGWVGYDHSTRIRGLTDWTRLATSAVEPEIPEPAEGQEAPVPGVGADPHGNDMWVADATGEGTVSLRWTDRAGRWSLLAAGVGENAQAPVVELTWPREVTTPYLWPAVGAAAVLLLAGLFLLMFRRRPASRRTGTDDAPKTSPAEARTPTTDAASESTPATPSLSGRWSGMTVPAPGSAGPTVRPTPEATPVTGAEDAEPAQPAARSSLTSRRSRRRGASAPSAPAPSAPAGTPDAPELAGTGTAPSAAPAQPAPTGRRWAFGPVSGTAARSAAPTPEPSPGPAPAQPSFSGYPASPGEAPGVPQAPAASAPPTATGQIRLTRRELRAQEEARRAAEQTGLTGRLRALTGQLPVVRPAQPPATPDPAAPPTRASRAQAWREAWGFNPEGDTQPGHNDDEGGAR